MHERAIETVGEPLPESAAISPPIIQRAEVVAFCLVALLILATVAVLYVARAFFLPVVTAVILGTMLSPAARRLEAFKVPRPVSAALIVILTWAAFVLMIGLISVPVMDWFGKLPELGPILKDKLHVFDRPLAIWHQLQAMLGTPDTGEASFQLPKVAWVQPTIEFLSPTFTEILLFFAVLVLFIASWPDLRRALVMNFPNHESRLRMLKICNAIETNLGGYLLTVTLINAGVGIATGIACAFAQMPNPAGLGDTQLHSHHRADPDVCDPAVCGSRRDPDTDRRADRTFGLRHDRFHRRAFRHTDHHRAASIAQRARRVSRFGVLDLAMGADGRVSIVSAADRGAHRQGAHDARARPAITHRLTRGNLTCWGRVSAAHAPPRGGASICVPVTGNPAHDRSSRS